MRRKILWFFAALLVVGLAYAAYAYFTARERETTPSQFTGLERSFADSILISPRDPEARIAVDPSFEYLGGQKFLLYGVAAVEQHMFGRKWPDGSPRTVMFVQFEEVLPEIDWSYDYSDSQYRSEINGRTFFVDVEPG